jgi:glycosyltransferase involved in cell wall biosynthesis
MRSVCTEPESVHASSCPSRHPVREILSVVIPTHNRAGLLRGAIASVLRSPLISSPRQIIVVADDCSDGTGEVAAEYGTTYLRVGYQNASATRNAGLRVSTTPYVNFLDDDDAWLPGNMEPQLSALEAEPNAAFAYGKACWASEDLEPLGHLPPGPVDLIHGVAPERLYRSHPQLGVVLFRRSALEEVGGFDSNITFAEDADLLLRIGARHPIVGIDSIGMLHRIRTPSKVRSDYYWKGRIFVNWWPKELGIGWSDYVRHVIHARGHFAFRFCEDFYSCATQDQRRDALLCMARALRMSLPHSLLRNPLFWCGLRELFGASVSEQVWWDRSGVPA